MDHVAECPFRAVGGVGGGASRAAARKRQGGNTPRDKTNLPDPQALWIRLLGMVNRVVEPPPGGDCGGVAGGGGIADLGDGELWS